MSVSACRWSPAPPPPTTGSARWCDVLPRPANAALERVSVSTDWFEVYRAGDGVFAIAEPFQFQDTRANAKGFDHAALAGEVAPDSFCRGAPKGADTAAFRTRPWTPSRTVADHDKIDLGGRVLEILHVPGHTPDAIALLDRANGLLWTGDSYYEGTIWLYVPETNLDDYERSIARLAVLAPGLKKLLPAHNTALAEPRRLVQAKDAIRQVRAGAMKGTAESDNRLVFGFDGFSILVSKPLLQGKTGDATRGGSGLTTWR
jgi:glyoxylase-like metal-dependent hydrolase (beta-lactamase superfamily II)